MGANIQNKKTLSGGIEETQSRLELAREILLSRTIAEPWSFAAVSDIIRPEMFGQNLAWDQGVMLAAIELYKKEGQYTTLSLARKSGVEPYLLQTRASQHPETTLSEAVENFIHHYGRSVEMTLALNLLGGAYDEEDSFGIQAKLDARRKEAGVVAIRKQDNSVELADIEFKKHIDGEEIIYPVRPFLSGLRSAVGHYGAGDFIVVGAATGVGKSFFANGQAMWNAMNGVKSLIVNLEMPEGDVRKRLFQMRSGLKFGPNLHSLPEEKMRLAMLDWNWAKTTKDIQVVNPGRDLSSIIRTMRQAKAEGCGFIAMDYFQLLRDSTLKARAREAELSSICADLRALQLEMAIPMMVLAQGNRESQKTASRRLTLATLGGTTQLENDATLAHLIYRPMALTPPVTHDDNGVPYSEEYADITNAKGRNVGLAFVECEFDKFRGFVDKGALSLNASPQFPTKSTSPDFNPATILQSARPMNDDQIPF